MKTTINTKIKIHNQFDFCLNATKGARSRSAGLLDSENRKYGNKPLNVNFSIHKEVILPFHVLIKPFVEHALGTHWTVLLDCRCLHTNDLFSL